jgi:polyisoprenoid-binding protein YceI
VNTAPLRLLAALGMALGPLSPGAAFAQSVHYTLDPAHTAVHFEVLHFGTSTIHGRFTGLNGTVTIDRASGRGELGLRVATASVSTGIPIFDARLRRDDLLASEAHPEAYFVASGFAVGSAADGTPSVSTVRGEFTWRGHSQPLQLTAQRFSCRQDPVPGSTTGQQVCGGDFEAELLRSDFGATFGLPLVGNLVRLRVQVEGLRR